jgi:hypothetical protein
VRITCSAARYSCEIPVSRSEKKRQAAIIATEIRGCVDEPKATYLKLLCCRVELEQRNIVDPRRPVVLVIRS